jgi:hypothetical protein
MLFPVLYAATRLSWIISGYDTCSHKSKMNFRLKFLTFIFLPCGRRTQRNTFWGFIYVRRATLWLCSRCEMHLKEWPATLGSYLTLLSQVRKCFFINVMGRWWNQRKKKSPAFHGVANTDKVPNQCRCSHTQDDMTSYISDNSEQVTQKNLL